MEIGIYILTLYKDHHILAESFSNLFQSNELLRKLARVFAYENNFGACLLINNEKKIAESTHGSVFLIFGNKVLTPPLSSGVVDDFSRKIMIKFINQNNSYQIVEEEISVYNLQRADEIFLFSFIYGFINISQFRKKKFSTYFFISLKISFERGFQVYLTILNIFHLKPVIDFSKEFLCQHLKFYP